MKAFGIEFTHRRPEVQPWVAKDFAEFMAFSAGCDAVGVARYVHGVFFDSKSQVFNIDASAAVEGGAIAGVIRLCAEDSFSQFVLFGEYWCREDSKEPRE